MVFSLDAVTPTTNPWELFAAWFAEAEKAEPSYPNAMTVATVGDDGYPATRTLLMKDFTPEGITFYTNRESRKGGHLAVHRTASITFYWKSLQRQIHAEGDVVWVDDATSDAYFSTRPRGSQIGAWASAQSRPLATRAELEDRVRALEDTYAGRDVPRPPHWGGYCLKPHRMEFWQEREFRLHDRFVFVSKDHALWSVMRVSP